jgi:hypothetical protein
MRLLKTGQLAWLHFLLNKLNHNQDFIKMISKLSVTMVLGLTLCIVSAHANTKKQIIENIWLLSQAEPHLAFGVRSRIARLTYENKYITPLHKNHDDERMRNLFAEIRDQRPKFFEMGGNTGNILHIEDPENRVAPFLLSDKSDSSLDRQAAATYCAERGERLATREELKAVGRAMTIDGRYDQNAIEGMAGTGVWSMTLPFPDNGFSDYFGVKDGDALLDEHGNLYEVFFHLNGDGGYDLPYGAPLSWSNAAAFSSGMDAFSLDGNTGNVHQLPMETLMSVRCVRSVGERKMERPERYVYQIDVDDIL